jgi:hypothetical protein
LPTASFISFAQGIQATYRSITIGSDRRSIRESGSARAIKKRRKRVDPMGRWELDVIRIDQHLEGVPR